MELLHVPLSHLCENIIHTGDVYSLSVVLVQCRFEYLVPLLLYYAPTAYSPITRYQLLVLNEVRCTVVITYDL